MDLAVLVELWPFFGFLALCGVFLVLVFKVNGRPVRKSLDALAAWARQAGHHWDEAEGRVTGRAGGWAFVAEVQPQYYFGDRRRVPLMTFEAPQGLPESELRRRLVFGFTVVINRISGLAPLRLRTEDFRHRTHEILGKDVRFLEDAWARGLGDVLRVPHSSLSYRITPESRLEVDAVGGAMPAWTEQALAEAAATGEQLCRLFAAILERRPG